jgi:hypothetical protein
MKTTTTYQLTQKTLIFSIIMMCSLWCNACRLTLVPQYDSTIAQQIENVSKSIDKLYLTMLETTTEANNGRAYSKFAESYIAIEIELHSLLNKNKVRKNNGETVKICEDVVCMFDNYKNEHKKENTISDATITLNLEYMRGILYLLMIAEETKK